MMQSDFQRSVLLDDHAIVFPCIVFYIYILRNQPNTSHIARTLLLSHLIKNNVHYHYFFTIRIYIDMNWTIIEASYLDNKVFNC